MVRTDAQGRFHLVVNPGPFGLTATYPTLQGCFQGKLVAEAGKALSGLSLQLESGGHTITGHLLGPDGHPVKNALVSFARFSEDEGDQFFAHMKGDQFEINLGSGSYLLEAKAPGLMDMSESMTLKGNVLQKQIQMQIAPSPAPPEVKAWIKAQAMPLATPEAGHGFVDMQPLKAMVGRARVVSLGEATHGTREFFQLKHRMLEFLVEEMGFTVFAIEAYQPEARAINDYVLQGKGDPAKALSGLGFWTWDTEEVLEMIHWMRRYNEDSKHMHKVKFFGFDMNSPETAWRNVRNYLGKVDTEGATWMETSLKELGSGAASRSALSTERKQNLAKAAGELVARFDTRKETYQVAQDPKAYPDARHDAKILAQSAEMGLNAQENGLVRDRCMAENVQWILEQEEGAKAVLWAHNGHVSAGYRGVSEVMGGFTSMGVHLRKALGSDMLVLGFSFLEGGFQAGDMKQGLLSFQVKPNPKATLALALASVGYPILALDLRKLPKEGPVSAWFKRPQGRLELGSMFSPRGEDDYIKNEKIAEHFDGLLFVSNTSSARPNTRPVK
jgi:erythromycin esterase